MSYKLSDLQLADQFGLDISKDYALAVEFLSLYPSHSLMSFRQVLEGLCHEIGKLFSIDVSELNLSETVNELFAAQAITHDLKSKMHELRKLGNIGVHRQFHDQGDDSSPSETVSEQARIIKERQSEVAQRARKLTVLVLESSYLALKLGDVVPRVELIKVDDQVHKETLFGAACSTDVSLKLKAGLIYESMALDQPLTKAIIMTHSSKAHRESLLQLAAAHYEAAMKISADIDHNLFELGDQSEDEFIFKNCDIEPLFRFGLIASEGILGDPIVDRGREILKKASLRGHSEAAARYAAILYDEEQNYPLAKQFALKAAAADEPMGHQILFHYYSQGIACDTDESKAMLHLETAIDLGCADSIGLLGSLYTEGHIVQQDRDKAYDLLQEAIEKGSSWANRYYHVEFNDLAGRLAGAFKKVAESMSYDVQQVLKYIDENRPKPKLAPKKVGRNDPCPCGSGIKYKKCPCSLEVL